MDKYDKELVVGIFVVFLFVLLIGVVAKYKEDTPPDDFIEFSPRDGVVCIKHGKAMGCWKE